MQALVTLFSSTIAATLSTVFTYRVRLWLEPQSIRKIRCKPDCLFTQVRAAFELPDDDFALYYWAPKATLPAREKLDAADLPKLESVGRCNQIIYLHVCPQEGAAQPRQSPPVGEAPRGARDSPQGVVTPPPVTPPPQFSSMPDGVAIASKRNVPEHVKKRTAHANGWLCYKCNKLLPAEYEIDHYIPLDDGGTNAENNLFALCLQCHASKTSQEFHSWRRAHAPKLSVPESGAEGGGRGRSGRGRGSRGGRGGRSRGHGAKGKE